MTTYITRTTDTDDDGSGLTGTVHNNAWLQAVYDAIENAMANLLDPKICEGRLTLTSGTPVTTSDVTGATTIYFTPYNGNYIALYDGTSRWALVSFTEKSVALGTLTNDLPYDVFAYNNSGTVTLEILAWSSKTARATALTTQNGVYVKSGATTRRYLGTFHTTSTTTTEDSAAKRFLWNYNNRVARALRRLETTASWTYSSTVRQANGSTSNQVDVVVGVAEDAIVIRVQGSFSNTTVGAWAYVAVGEDAVTVSANCTYAIQHETSTSVYRSQLTSGLTTIPAIGRHYFTWLEATSGDATGTFYGTNNGTAGITGMWRA